MKMSFCSKATAALSLCLAPFAAADVYDFTPIPASIAAGALPEEAPLLLPDGYSQELVVSFADLVAEGLSRDLFVWDMLAWATPTDPVLEPKGFNGKGKGAQSLHPRADRFLFIPSEVSIGDPNSDDPVTGAGLFRYDLKTGNFATLMESNDSFTRTSDPAEFDPLDDAYTRFDPATYTPFGTVIVGEETTGGRLFEVQNPWSNSQAGAKVRWLSKVPGSAHEGLRFDSEKVLYFVDENSSGSVYKYVPTFEGDLAVGQTFVLSVDNWVGNPAANAAGDRTGPATWVPITDEMGNALTVADPFVFGDLGTGGRVAADEVGGTPFVRPEDMVIKRLASGNEAMIFTATGEDAVYSVEFLSDSTAMVRLFVGLGVTLDYGAGAPLAGGSTGFNDPDNLALGPDGRVYIIEDQGNGGPIGGDVWATCDADNDGVAESVARFFSLSSFGAEPSGMVFDPADPDSFIIIAQHPVSSLYVRSGVAEDGEIGEALIRVTKDAD